MIGGPEGPPRCEYCGAEVQVGEEIKAEAIDSETVSIVHTSCESRALPPLARATLLTALKAIVKGRPG